MRMHIRVHSALIVIGADRAGRSAACSLLAGPVSRPLAAAPVVSRQGAVAQAAAEAVRVVPRPAAAARDVLQEAVVAALLDALPAAVVSARREAAAGSAVVAAWVGPWQAVLAARGPPAEAAPLALVSQVAACAQATVESYPSRRAVVSVRQEEVAAAHRSLSPAQAMAACSGRPLRPPGPLRTGRLTMVAVCCSSGAAVARRLHPATAGRSACYSGSAARRQVLPSPRALPGEYRSAVVCHSMPD